MGIGSAPSTSRTPSMASLVQKAWKVKRQKELATSQAMWPKKKLQSVPKSKSKPTYSPLLSRRLGKRVLMTIEIPPPKPFPPPLVWKPTPRTPARLYARPFARPPPRPLRCKRPESSMSHQFACAGH